MTRSSQSFVAVMVALGLAVPTIAGAQGRNPPAGSSSSGTAESRGGASSGGGGGGSVATSTGGGSTGGSSGTAVTRGPSTGGQAGMGAAQPLPSRDRNGRPVVGSASTRMLGTVTGLPGPTFGPWGRYFPWYSTGFGWNYGFYQFDPYSGYGYGYGLGPWYDPFFYDPFNPFGYGYSTFRYGGYYSPMADYGGGSSSATTTHLTGSIRLKVSPDTAKVYVDGVLAGAASEFDGLFSHHLTLEGGMHQFELRADGYETYHSTLTVDPGKTITERVSMKKSK